jgi:hypothetical protein
MPTSYRFLSLLPAAALLALAPATPAQDRWQDHLAPILDQLLPPATATDEVPAEPWQLLPWELSLIDAAERARASSKPIYMLVRSGHPLGCV